MEITASFLSELARAYRFPVSRVISLQTLISRIGQLAVLPTGEKKHMLEVLTRETALEGVFLVCCLSCYRPTPQQKKVVPPAYGLIADFAAFNYYREAVRRLQHMEREICAFLRIKRPLGRIFCNSHLPEKIIAFASGIGFYGRNGLIINPLLGSNLIVACLFLPLTLSGTAAPLPPMSGGCGKCRCCQAACPAGAIGAYAVVDRTRCFQALAPHLQSLPEQIREKWGNRIYGCQVCQDVCPYNNDLYCETATGYGKLGPAVPLCDLLERSDASLERFLKPTVLGRKWIDPLAIKRNALLAAGNSRDRKLLPVVEKYLASNNIIIRETAGWAVSRIGH